MIILFDHLSSAIQCYCSVLMMNLISHATHTHSVPYRAYTEADGFVSLSSR